jgi:hypothetical protein
MMLVKMDTRISVIVLNWNERRWLEKCLPSILEQSVADGFEVLLVDNGSTDDSVEYVKREFPQVKLLSWIRARAPRF